MAGDVQRVEIIPIRVDLRPFGDGKAHLGQDRGHLFRHLTDRVNGALTHATRRQRHVQPFRPQAFVQRGIAQRGLLGGKGRVDLVLQRIQRRPGDLPLLGRHLAKLAHFQRHFAFFAHGRQADLLQRGFVAGIGNQVQVF